MDPNPDTSTNIPTDQPPVINYVLSFLLVGVAWGFTTPFIRRAAADFNARQDAKWNIKQNFPRRVDGEGDGEDEDEGQKLLGGERDRDRDMDGEREDDNVDLDGVEGDEEGDNKSEDSNQQHANESSGRRTSPAPGQSQRQPAWLNPPQPRTTWVKNKLITLFWTIINLLRTPAYSIPLVINLTGSIWFFLLVGKHGMYLLAPLTSR